MKSLLGKLGVLFIGLLILGNAGVWGADWKSYDSNEKFSSYYDAQSITHPSKDIVRVWIRLVWTEKGVLSWVNGVGKEYGNLSHSMSLMEINCAEKKCRRLLDSVYDNKGDVIISSHSPKEWAVIIPESVGDGLNKEACK
jgi:hypothetical protein